MSADARLQSLEDCLQQTQTELRNLRTELASKGTRAVQRSPCAAPAHLPACADVTRIASAELARMSAANEMLELEISRLRQQQRALANDVLIAAGQAEADIATRLGTMRTAMNALIEARADAPRFGGSVSASSIPHGRAPGEKPRRVFAVQASRLSEMLRVPEFATIHNLFVAIVIMAGLNILISDYLEKGELLDLSLLWWCFGDFDRAALIWAGMIAASLLLLPLAWLVHHRTGVLRSLAIAAYVALQLTFYAGSAFITRHYRFPPATAFALLIEQTRISLKMHSYLRESYPRSLDDYEHSTVQPAAVLAATAPEGASADAPWLGWGAADEVRSYFYFLFVPTLLYRRSYPVSYGRRFSFIARCLAEVAATIYFVYVVFRFVGPQFKLKSNEAIKVDAIVLSVFSSMLPAMLIYVFGFFALLHAWMNGWAELLRS